VLSSVSLTDETDPDCALDKKDLDIKIYEYFNALTINNKSYNGKTLSLDDFIEAVNNHKDIAKVS
jgi:hypothetical protein